jgi:hypothetical protein
MSKKVLLILLLLTFACAACAQVETYKGKEYGPEYFFAIQGEVSGQAAPGVKSVLVNGKPVRINPDLSFQARVTLQEGEKYLAIKTSYKGLNFTKKYLVIRHPKAPKSFKIYVPESEFQKMISRAKPAVRRTVRKKPVVKKKEPVAPKYEAPPVFAAEEFKSRSMIKKLTAAIEKDKYGIKLTAPHGSVERLNQLLKTPSFYDKWRKRFPKKKLTDEIVYLVRATNKYRHIPFSKLTPAQQKLIMLLNRLLLELTYPELCPWLKNKVIEEENWLGYQFVAEIAPGELLVVRKVNGKYFALLYDVKTRIWLHLHDISAEEFRKLLEKGEIPVLFQPVDE